MDASFCHEKMSKLSDERKQTVSDGEITREAREENQSIKEKESKKGKSGTLKIDSLLCNT